MILFRCSHRNQSWPLTRGGVCYVCCLDCGREFIYDWKTMTIGTELTHPPLKALPK